ncbi:MAG: hypothetical protein IJG36_03065 [Synergistaceae bacterium]|nr:hypothetical protein [Synergistaceae bacterium]
MRKDVYEADQRALRMEISLGNERILKALEQFRVEMNGKLEQFRSEVNDKFSKVDSRLNSLETKFNALEAKVDDMGVYFNSRISDTHTYMGWGFATIGIIVAIAVVVIPLTKLFKEFFKPSVTVEQVKEISRSIAEEVVNAKLQTM